MSNVVRGGTPGLDLFLTNDLLFLYLVFHCHLQKCTLYARKTLRKFKESGY